MSLTILKEIEGILEERPIDKLIVKALINELRRKLSEYILIDEMMRKKYGMSFEEFKAKNVVKEKGYSFEVESDYCDWELAIDGIKTIKEKIEKLEKLL
ncbi:hypothetical protein [Archaeoglobus profundus]|uniref:Uncharacterized protein n=1 Tax=Archaeoglobus profundus (strain DSM 5631 / JCM 9629 / NBRC 100127 / Av18) TaxID=572546 RepID=D2RDP9_ARCPA|nr:hypothetical protein [Archaeoglobus profundus]ADB58243.1 hypothetical protein Arcpr_1191 [Archaeoglobus profundus DSM 5631]